MKITIVYDNVAWNAALTADWGFACVVETDGHTLLFDTGAKGPILIGNMDTLGIDPTAIEAIFISHNHGDHTGGLTDVLRRHPTTVFLPGNCPVPKVASRVFSVEHSMQLFADVYSTGLLNGVEQSLVIRQRAQVVVIAGCSHPGVATIITAASRLGKVTALIGGLHSFDTFSLIDALDVICPAHCTQHIDGIKQRYPHKYLPAGAGRILEL